jgi:hypothetical protein
VAAQKKSPNAKLRTTRCVPNCVNQVESLEYIDIFQVWMAEQKHMHDKKKQEDMLNQYQKEQDMYGNR